MHPETNVDVEVFDLLIKVHESKIIGLVGTFAVSLACFFTGCSLLFAPNQKMHERIKHLEARLNDIEDKQH
jgi:hypothetical protein